MLALFAGTGALPGILAAALRGRGAAFALCEMEGVRVADLGETARLTYRIETLGTLMAALRDADVTEVAFAGALERPVIDPARIDAPTRPLLDKLIPAIARGDDETLRAVLVEFEGAGFAVRSVQDLAPELLPPAGIPTRARPGDGDRIDAARSAEIVAAMGDADIGQACIVADGQALAIEAQPGTAWMLRSIMTPEAQQRRSGDPLLWAFDTASGVVSDWADWLGGPVHQASRSDSNSRDPAMPSGGILFKAPKPAQDRRIDLPTIGPETMMLAAEAGLRGVVIEAGGVLVMDLGRVVKIADSWGLFLWVREGEV